MTRYAIYFLLLISLISGNCVAQTSQSERPITLSIQSVFNSEKLEKEVWYNTSLGDSIQLEKLRFYLTDVTFKDVNGFTHQVENAYYLIDAFDSATTAFQVRIPEDFKPKQITFNIGVDEQLHDKGALSGALDPIHGMYWAWQSGFINFKIEGKSPSCDTRKNEFTFHIGGYQQPFSTTQKVTLELDKDEDTIILQLDLAAFFKGISLKETNQVMIPGQQAHELSLKLPNLFSIAHE